MRGPLIRGCCEKLFLPRRRSEKWERKGLQFSFSTDARFQETWDLKSGGWVKEHHGLSGMVRPLRGWVTEAVEDLRQTQGKRNPPRLQNLQGIANFCYRGYPNQQKRGWKTIAHASGITGTVDQNDFRRLKERLKTSGRLGTGTRYGENP